MVDREGATQKEKTGKESRDKEVVIGEMMWAPSEVWPAVGSQRTESYLKPGRVTEQN